MIGACDESTLLRVNVLLKHHIIFAVCWCQMLIYSA